LAVPDRADTPPSALRFPYTTLFRSGVADEDAFERKLYLIRRRVQNAIAKLDLQQEGFFYVNSLSCRTLIYKGLLMAEQIAAYFLDRKSTRLNSSHQLISYAVFCLNK